MDSKNLYVGGISYSTSENQLAELFAAYGTVEATRIITNKDTGRSRGYGFVEMSSQAEAEEAAKQLNGSEVDGRTLTVDEAKPRETGHQAGNQRRW